MADEEGGRARLVVLATFGVCAREAKQALPSSLQPYLARWQLVADGDAIRTHGSDLLPVRTEDGMAAMLKFPRTEEEQIGSRLMPWWEGDAAPVIAFDASGALLMQRASGDRSLADWSLAGRDDDAIRVLCDMAGRLHVPRAAAIPPGLVPLREWFRALETAARSQGELLAEAWSVAIELLDEANEAIPLHGDLHHDNVLDFGEPLGWRVIDPKGLVGDRGFDYANLFCNPQPPGVVTSDVSLAPGRLERRLDIVSSVSGLEPHRLLRWLLAYCGLSAAWILDDGDEAGFDLAMAHKAWSLLRG